MSDFSFNSTAGTSQDTRKPNLEGNKIHDVTFVGCELKDIQGVKEPGKVFKQLILKFENEFGEHQITIWEPKADDFKRGEREYTKKDGEKAKMPTASNVENLMLLFKVMKLTNVLHIFSENFLISTLPSISIVSFCWFKLYFFLKSCPLNLNLSLVFSTNSNSEIVIVDDGIKSAE